MRRGALLLRKIVTLQGRSLLLLEGEVAEQAKVRV